MRRFVFATCTGWVVALTGCGESPEAAYRKIGVAAEKGDWGTVWDRIDKRTQGRMEMGLKMLAGFGAAFSKDEAQKKALQGASGRDLFIQMASKNADVGKGYRPAKVLSSSVSGDRATLKVSKWVDGKETIQDVPMVKEDGIWKIGGDLSKPDG